ncbi:MAG: GPH family glycoside/pentoside/hexuronide:cation symporter [Halieaceae bacterium]|jgi:GPH family glycoside/pentoside/hexuronide:cation symporter
MTADARVERAEEVRAIQSTVKFAWGSGALGVAVLMNTVAFFGLYYMVGVLKIEPALAGTLIFVTKLFDVITDPLVGSWSDRLTRVGSRRRPFLLVGAIVSPLAFLMIFTTPMFEAQVFTASYIFVAMLIYTFGYTLFNVPYISMPAEMTDDYHERSKIHGVRMIFVSLAGILAGAGTPALLDALGRKNWDAYAAVGAIGALIIFVSMMVAWWGTRNARFTVTPKRAPDLLAECRHVFADRIFIRLLSVKASQLLAAASMQSAMAFFVVYVLQRDFDLLSYYGLSIGIASLIASPLIVRFSAVVGKRGAYMFAAICSILVTGSWILAAPGDPTWMVLLRGVVIAVAVSGNVIMAMSMLTDIINYSARHTDIRREGVYTAFYSFVEKFTFALGPLIVGVAMSVAGFDESLPDEALQTPEIRQALLLAVSYIPIAMNLLSIYLLRGYRLSKEDLDA